MLPDITPPLETIGSSDILHVSGSAATDKRHTDVADVFSRLRDDATGVATLFREIEARNKELQEVIQKLTKQNERLGNLLDMEKIIDRIDRMISESRRQDFLYALKELGFLGNYQVEQEADSSRSEHAIIQDIIKRAKENHKYAPEMRNNAEEWQKHAMKLKCINTALVEELRLLRKVDEEKSEANHRIINLERRNQDLTKDVQRDKGLYEEVIWKGWGRQRSSSDLANAEIERLRRLVEEKDRTITEFAMSKPSGEDDAVQVAGITSDDDYRAAPPSASVHLHLWSSSGPWGTRC